MQAAEFDGPARGIAFLLVEGLGNVAAADIGAQLKGLSKDSRGRLAKLGVRFGVRHVFLPSMLRAKAIELRARLWAVQEGTHNLTPPQSGRVALDAEGFDRRYAPMIGFEQLGRHALRIDIVERLAADLRRASKEGAVFMLSPGMMALTGLGRDDLACVVASLGFVADADGAFRRQAKRPRRKTAKKESRELRDLSASPFAALRDLCFNTGTA